MKYVNRFRVAPGRKIKLKDIDPGFKDQNHEKHKDATEEVEQDLKKLRDLQCVLGWLIAGLGFLMVLEGLWRGTRHRDYQPPPQTPGEVRELEDETDEWFDEPDWAK